MKPSNDQLKLAANTIRCLAIDMIQKANSGHPGAPMGLADIAATLWLRFLKFDPAALDWADRDRFVLSGGHGSTLLYSLLHLSGAGLTMDDLQGFRQFGTRCPGHPERGDVPGVEVTTGPLGQGIAMAVGMAIAERMSAARDGEIVDHRTWCFCGDGDLEEGISHEACSLAGCLKLNKLVLFYDSNKITIEGATSIAMNDDAKKRFESYGWKVFDIDGHDYDQIASAIRRAMKVADRPSVIVCHTHIGFGSPNKHDSAEAHGSPLGPDEVALTKKALGFDPTKSFFVPPEVSDLFKSRARSCHRLNLAWQKSFAAWAAANPEKAAARKAAFELALPADIESALPAFDPAKPVATRAASGSVLNAIAPKVPYLVGGSADLAPSNKTYLKGLGDIGPGAFAGRNFHFGIRELAMTAIVNGIAAHGGFRPYGATFFVFSDYCKPALRLAALMKLPSIFVFSHDSFYVGEDGPTHEPVEQLASLRSMPNVLVLRPADPNETSAAWLAALRHTSGPSCIMVTRQNLAVLPLDIAGVAKGAYVVYNSRPQATSHEPPADLLFLATGSEVSLCIDAAKALAAEGKSVRVVSIPSWELFAAQPQAYQDSVIPPSAKKRVIVEAAVRFGWERFAADPAQTRYVTLDHFGASAPYKVLAEKFGFTAANVLATARTLL